MNKYENVAQDSEGNVIENATVTVKEYPGGANATIYSANSTSGGNVNGFLTGADGSFEFFAANGRYNVEISKPGRTTKINYNILLEDLSYIKTVPDFGTLAQALAAAGSGFVFEKNTGQLWLLGGVTPTFDEASDVVARCLGFDTGATLTIPAGKQFDAIAWGDTGTDQTFSIGATGIGSLMRFNMTAAASSNASSNLYGVIGAVTNLGPGNTKALYGRAIAGTGCTGVVTGAVIGAQSIAGATAYGQQMTFDTDTSGTITAGIWQTSNTATTAKLDYGLLLDDIAIQSGGAGFQMRAKSTGDFLRLNNSAGSANLWKVDSTGKQTIGTASNGLEFTASTITRNVVGGNFSIEAGSTGTLFLGVGGVYPIEVSANNVSIGNGFKQTLVNLTYSTSMTPAANNGNIFVITATDGVAFAINAPTNPATGQRVVFTIRNTSGGALGAATWNAVFKMVAWTQPATGFSRSIQFYYNGTNWIEESRCAADVPN